MPCLARFSGIPWFNSGVSENATSGQIQLCIPGVLACFQCAPPYVVATKEDENSIKREGVCAASLPTTMGVTAGFLVQNALKFLLGFGRPSTFVGWESLQDYFTTLRLRPNDQCADAWCCKRQKEVQEEGLTLEDYLPRVQEEKPTDGPLHEENPFGISLVDDGEEYENEKSGSHACAETRTPACASSVDDLAAKLKSLQS
ncbi:thiF family domain-containing protein, putative [Eimeria mitis]|uniref:ThiF family domain-containing protein, putative n=1 Tax=Eimeria mitis TaxID=44415 RepID=U6KE40_9EIME|nr:thiF family domain-containing protein, putative [Eimeria mitis]CDJ36214.1 thiF family domain-containing protein, putative [Eimeria mitis]